MKQTAIAPGMPELSKIIKGTKTTNSTTNEKTLTLGKKFEYGKIVEFIDEIQSVC